MGMANTLLEEMLAEKAGYFASLFEEASKVEQDKDKPRVQKIVTNGTILADTVQVVRCKDCKHWCDSWVAPDGKHEHGYCHMEEADDVIVGRWDDDFCSYGERKDNG